MTPGEAVMELTRLGFRFRLEGEAVKVRFEGEQTPDPTAVSPLLDMVRRHREDVHFFLRCYCAKCGGCCFAPDYEGRPLCMAYDWDLLVDASKRGKINEAEAPQATPSEKTHTCFECPRHEHDTVNPTQGWGRCTLKKRGYYGLRPACSEIHPQDTDAPLDG